MALRFEWNSAKAARNVAKHGVTFDEASTVFGDAISITIADRRHSDEEDRWVTIGSTPRGRILVVVHTDRFDGLRVISAREATRIERETYEKALSKR